MKPMQIAMALLSAVMFFILAGVFMGVQLELNGTKLVVDTAASLHVAERPPCTLKTRSLCLSIINSGSVYP